MLRILLVLLLMTGIAQAEWDVNIPVSSDVLTDFPTDNQENLDRLELVLREYPKGITLAYSSASTIVVSSGGVVCADSGGTTKKFRGNTSSTNVTFSDLDTGSESSGTYYIYATCDAVATTASFKISTSSSAPTGITSYKRLGSFVNDGSNNITASSITNDSVWTGHTLGAWASKSFGSAYLATTDGIFMGYCTNTGSSSTTIYCYSDTSSSPTTVRVQSTIGSNTGGTLSCTAPVKKGEYYKVDQANGCTASQVVYFIPMGS